MLLKALGLPMDHGLANEAEFRSAEPGPSGAGAPPLVQPSPLRVPPPARQCGFLLGVGGKGLLGHQIFSGQMEKQSLSCLGDINLEQQAKICDGHKGNWVGGCISSHLSLSPSDNLRVFPALNFFTGYFSEKESLDTVSHCPLGNAR